MTDIEWIGPWVDDVLVLRSFADYKERERERDKDGQVNCAFKNFMYSQILCSGSQRSHIYVAVYKRTP